MTSAKNILNTMKNQLKQEHIPQTGNRLWMAVMTSTFCGLFISFLGIGLIWAGEVDLGTSPLVWKISLAMNFVFFIASWITYIPFRKTDRLLGMGLLGMLAGLGFFWLLGFSGFYFYFLFAQINNVFRAVALFGMTVGLIYRCWMMIHDIKQALASQKGLLSRIYVDEGSAWTYAPKGMLLLQKALPERNPFKDWYVNIVILMIPFSLAWNRLLTPLVGSGHGVFLVLAFLATPMLLWAISAFVLYLTVMVYYPLKLERETGKPVLMKNW